MKRIIFFLLTVLGSIGCLGQERSLSIKEVINFSDLPNQSSDTPDWAKPFYKNPDGINIFKLQESMKSWITKEEKEREKEKRENKSENKKEKEEENELEESITEIPIVRFALFFLKNIPSEWIDDKGFLQLPSQEKYLAKSAQLKPSNKVSGPSSWAQIGPIEMVNSSDGTSRPWQTNVYYIGISPSNPQIRIASLEVGALFKTVDGGNNWTFLTDLAGPIAFHPTDPNNFIVGGSPMKQSKDGGITWTTKDVPSNSNEVVWSDDGNTILAATTNGIYVSNNSGGTFSQKLSGTFHDITFMPNSNTIAYAINDKGDFYKTTNAGITWTLKTTNYTLNTPKEGYLLGVTANNPNLVVIAFLSQTNTELIKSTNAGESFTPISVFNTGFSLGYYAFVFGISPGNENIFYLGGTTLFKSTNGGLNFNALGGYYGNFQIHPDIQDLRFIGNNEVVVATDGGIIVSSDNFISTSNLKSTNRGIFALNYWGFDAGFNTDQMGGGKYHNGNNIYNPNWNNGKTISLGGAESPVGVAIFSRPNSMYYADIFPGFYQSDVNYNYRVPTTYPFVMTNNNYYYGVRISDIISNVLDSNIIYAATGNSVMISYNNGMSQQNLYSFGSTVWNIKPTRSNPNILYVMTESSGLWKTNDGGKTWNICSLILNGQNSTSNGRNLYIDVSQTDPNELWLAVANNNGPFNANSQRMFRSTNGGQTWTSLDSSTLSQFRIKEMAHQYGTHGGIYIMGTDNNGRSRCYYKNNTMPDWVDFSNNLMIRTINSNQYVKLSYFQEKIRIAGHRGIQESAFYEPYTNPVAQPTTNIKEICINQRVKLADYSILKTSGATWNWSFSKTPVYLNGTNSMSQNPEVKFLSPGPVDATLKVTDIYNKSDTKTITNFLKVNYDSSSCLSLNSDGDVLVNCTNNIPQGADINAGNKALITNFNNASTGEFLVKLNVFSNCYSTSAKLTAIVNITNNTIQVLSYKDFNNAGNAISGNNTNTIKSISSDFAAISFTLNGNNLYLNHIYNPCNSVISMRASCWKPYTKIDGGDSDEIQKCQYTIPQSESTSNNSAIAVTNFNGATTGLYYVNLNAYTACNTSTNNLKAIINLDNSTISVLAYKHFGDSKVSDVTGNDTGSVVSILNTNAQVTYYLNNRILYIKKNSDACNGGTAFRLNPSCWAPLDKDNNSIDNTEQPSSCNNPLSTSQITDNNSYLIKDFNSIANATDNVFVNLTIKTNCSSATATLYLNIDLSNNIIHVLNYKHFGSTSPSSGVINNDSGNVYSESSDIAQLKFILNNRSLYIQRLQTSCAGSYYEVVNSCYSTDSECSIAAPTGSITQNICTGANLDDLTTKGNDISWYDSPSNGTLLDLSTPLLNGETYYASQTVDNCESYDRLPVTALLNHCSMVGINTPNPTSVLTVNGSVSKKITAINTSTTLDISHSVILSNSTSGITLTLPSANGIKGRSYTIKNIGTGNTLIKPSANEKIDLGNSATLSSGQIITIVSDDTGWKILKKM